MVQCFRNHFDRLFLKLYIHLAYSLAIPFLFIQEKMKAYVHAKDFLYINVHNWFFVRAKIQQKSNVQQQWMDTCNNMDKCQNRQVEWKKPYKNVYYKISCM